jgi:hypothetical protein
MVANHIVQRLRQLLVEFSPINLQIKHETFKRSLKVDSLAILHSPFLKIAFYLVCLPIPCLPLMFFDRGEITLRFLYACIFSSFAFCGRANGSHAEGFPM